MNHREWIELYAAEADAPAKAIEGLTAAEFHAFPIPGTWSIQQIVVHLMQSDLIGTDRMQRVAAEQVPLIVNYDESAFIRNLAPEKTDPFKACELFRLNREIFAETLRALPDAAFDKHGVHSVRGVMTLGDVLQTYVEHARGHLVHLRKKRGMLGKPLK